MAEQKRYYWLKLKEDFFDDETISYIEEQENGVLYVNFYLKLCLKALKTDGSLIRLIGENLIPYDAASLSRLTRTPVDTVRVAMSLFEKIGLIKIYDTGEIFLSQINEMIGTETSKAALMRRKRAEEKLIGNNVTTMLPECYTEKEKDIDIEKEKEHADKVSSPSHKKTFLIPSLEEVKAYCIERKNRIDAEAFIDFYNSKDWMIGKNKMKDWKAAIRNWERREKADEKPNIKKNAFTSYEQRDYDFDEIERLEEERNRKTL